MAKKQHNAEHDTVVPADLVYGEVRRDMAALPNGTLHALAQRGFTHILGNEIASAISSFKEKNPGASDDDVAAKRAELTTAKLAAMDNGTLGVRVGGARVRGIDAVIADVAEEFVIRNVTRKGKAAALPKKGKGYAAAMAALVANAMANSAFAESVKAEADRRFNAPDVPDVELVA